MDGKGKCGYARHLCVGVGLWRAGQSVVSANGGKPNGIKMWFQMAFKKKRRIAGAFAEMSPDVYAIIELVATALTCEHLS